MQDKRMTTWTQKLTLKKSNPITRSKVFYLDCNKFNLNCLLYRAREITNKLKI